jgi:hypothetical protein
LRQIPGSFKGLSFAQVIVPSKIHPYIDVLVVWLRVALTPSQLSWLRPRAGGRKMRVHNGRARFNRHYVQRLTVYQPSNEALQSLATCEDALLTYLEISLDWIFEDQSDKDDAAEFVNQHLIKSHHRDQGIRFYAETRYTGPRSAPNNIVTYADRASKGGSPHCAHFDWRIKGSGTLRRIGVNCVRDLLTFSHREFWRTRLRLCAIDRGILGRMYHNWQKGTKRRSPWITFDLNRRFVYDHDSRAGGTIVRVLQSSQAVVDMYRKRFEVDRCLVPYEITHLLPA